MSGVKTGVKTQIQVKQPRALYTHCYGHALSLIVADTVRMMKSLGNVMDTVHELSKLLQYSPKRSTLFKALKERFPLTLLDFESYVQPNGLYAMKHFAAF